MMLARLLAFFALALAAIPAGSAPADWTKVAATTAAGGIRVGNPKARVSFVEIANYTCPHCAHFSQGGADTLARHIKAGKLAVEFRPITNNSVGLAATVVARCAAPAEFLAVNDALYAGQDNWYWPATAYAERNAGRLAAFPELDQLRLIAQRGGIADVAVKAGLPAERIAACFADRRMLDATLAAAKAAGAITSSTPTFLFNGGKVEGMTWPQMAARLTAAGLK